MNCKELDQIKISKFPNKTGMVHLWSMYWNKWNIFEK